MSPDRLAEIDYADYEVTEADVQWLIAEVKRLKVLVFKHHDTTAMSKLRNGLLCPVCSDQHG